MFETEGVVKYRLQFILDEPPCWEDFLILESWRRILFHLHLVGLDPNRYRGLAYGNVSQRLADGKFVISATQTGGMECLGPEHYCLIESADPATNSVVARGCYPPSSEALTHAAVYQASSKAMAVMHGHCPEIWRSGKRLALVHTRASVAHGTPAMAKAVMDQVRNRPEQGIISDARPPRWGFGLCGIPTARGDPLDRGVGACVVFRPGGADRSLSDAGYSRWGK